MRDVQGIHVHRYRWWLHDLFSIWIRDILSLATGRGRHCGCLRRIEPDMRFVGDMGGIQRNIPPIQIVGSSLI